MEVDYGLLDNLLSLSQESGCKAGERSAAKTGVIGARSWFSSRRGAGRIGRNCVIQSNAVLPKLRVEIVEAALRHGFFLNLMFLQMCCLLVGSHISI